MILPKPWIRDQILPGDASSRRYARVWDRHDRTAVLVLYPKSVRNQMSRDLEVRAWCAEKGLRVPALLDRDLAEGWAVLEDFGPDDAECALQNAPHGDREELGLQFVGPLVTLAGLQSTILPAWNPPLARARLRWELAGFELWFLRHHLEMAPSPSVGRWLDELAAAIGEHPKRVCHRDYHLNNLFLLADGTVGLIDYQDILVGPDTYDAVSLLCERGMPRVLPETERIQIQKSWAADTDARPGWSERWRLVSAQRGLKVLGTFARLAAGGAEAYGDWAEDLLRQIAPELAVLDAPTELVDLLLDLSRRRHSARDF
ncbi:MAG: phosphotransferase [Thermoanaerobaculales bacterium]|nr:phosphotransferase [Thermoanaerobaculales bacterium]